MSFRALSRFSESVSSALRTRLRFLSDQRGGIAIVFALLLVPLLGAVGIGIDYARAYYARERMRTALDAAVSAAALIKGTDAQRADAFSRAFLSNSASAGVSEPWATPDFSQYGYVNGTAGGSIATGSRAFWACAASPSP